MQILGSPAGVHAFWSASASESTRTTTPNATHTYEGRRVVRRSRALLSFRKHAAGKIYASAVAEMPPVISSVTPRSHVMRDTGFVSVSCAVVARRRMDEMCAHSTWTKK